MNRNLIAAGLVLVSGAAAAAPSVSGVSLAQDAATGVVTISYTLAGGPAIVTLDIETNGVSIGAANIRTLSGPMNCRVDKAGTYSVAWLAGRDWEGTLDASVRAVVKAWSLARPPDYMVVDLAAPSNVCYYAREADLPGGLFGLGDYRTTKLVMRRIPAKGKEWLMGVIGENTGNGIVADEKPHAVTMSADYWIGVFEFTQAQWAIVQGDGSRPSKFSSETDWAMRPVENVSYNEIRHGASASGDYASGYYPAAPGEGSLLYKLRRLSGLPFDLPGETQWEFACRAGTGEGSWNDGTAITNAWAKDATVGRFQDNGGGTSEDAGLHASAGGTAVVGSYAPSKWGTYDMHGNVAEFCLDWYAEDITGLGGAVNTTVSDKRIARGGVWSSYVNVMRSGARNTGFNFGVIAQDAKDGKHGFRVCCPVVAE